MEKIDNIEYVIQKCKVLKKHILTKQIDLSPRGLPYFLKIKRVFFNVGKKNKINIHILIYKSDYSNEKFLNFEKFYVYLNFITEKFFELKVTIRVYGNKQYYFHTRRSKTVLL